MKEQHTVLTNSETGSRGREEACTTYQQGGEAYTQGGVPQGVVSLSVYLRVWYPSVCTSGWCIPGFTSQGGVYPDLPLRVVNLTVGYTSGWLTSQLGIPQGGKLLTLVYLRFISGVLFLRFMPGVLFLRFIPWVYLLLG